jgi:hypothetical protein
VTEGIIKGASRLLADADSRLLLYGPWNVDGKFTAESNKAFDERLRSDDPSWGIRDITEVSTLAQTHGLELDESIAMPANNFIQVFKKS